VNVEVGVAHGRDRAFVGITRPDVGFQPEGPE
jgi:hypothetical protein